MPGTPKNKILVIEDDPPTRELLCQIVSHAGFEVDRSENGKYGLQRLRENSYDLIISDVNMPEMDGLTLYRRIKEELPGLEKKVLFLTCDPSGDTLSFFTSNRCNYMDKPFRSPDLLEKVGCILGTEEKSGQRRLKLLVSALAASILLSCAEGPKQRVLWPPPPDKPLLEFVGVYSSQGDIPKSGQRFLEAMTGKMPPALHRPFGIASDGRGRVYISDTIDRKIRVFDFNAKTVTDLAGGAVFDKPLGLALDISGNLYVADGKKGKVLVFSPAGDPLFSFGGKEILGRPSYIAINDRLGRVYVSDGERHRIAVFDMNGRHLFFIGGPGRGSGQFAVPQGLAVDKVWTHGRVFVADMLNARVQVLDADGKFLYTFGSQGRGYRDFENPRDLAFDSNGNLYVIDQRKGLLHTYTAGGRLIITGGAKKTSHPLGFSAPASICIDSSDRVYISDQLNRRFSVWRCLSEDAVTGGREASGRE